MFSFLCSLVVKDGRISGKKIFKMQSHVSNKKPLRMKKNLALMQKNYCFDHSWSVNELERKEKVNKVDKNK